MDKDRNEYIPALKYRWLTSLYDPLLRWSMRESTFKLRLLEQAQIKRSHRILDLGCGTATLTLLIKRAHPAAEVIALDGDLEALEIARTKAARAELDIILDHAMAFELPYPDDSFDRVLSSLLFHHLTRDNKCRTLREVFRAIRPGGELHVADWGKAQNSLMRSAFLMIQMLDGFETTSDNVNGELPRLILQAGFEDVAESTQYSTIFGTLSLYRARKPK